MVINVEEIWILARGTKPQVAGFKYLNFNSITRFACFFCEINVRIKSMIEQIHFKINKKIAMA